MTHDSFWRLFYILSPYIDEATQKGNRFQSKGVRGDCYLPPPVPNGPILASSRLACSIRYFAGGSPYDIMLAFGISYREVLNSVWTIVEAINNCPQFAISYPASPEEQRKIAAEFQAVSIPGISNCAGAIDGIIIWMLKPSEKEAAKAGVNQLKFLCGRKHKFGLNCQAVSDCRGRILDISIKFGASSSDLLAFEASELHTRLEGGLMHQDGENERFVLFGDNAYINTPYLATPFTNVAGDPNRAAEDSYNFYHSQLRIRVECAFGMLVQRWGILRTPMPRNLSVVKVVAIVNSLAHLHNFCIGEVDTRKVPQVFVDDARHINRNRSGHVDLTFGDNECNVPVPVDLMHGGEHFMDVPRGYIRARQSPPDQLPRTNIFNLIVDGHWERPTRL